MNRPRIVEQRVGHAEAWQWDGSPECGDLIVDWIIDNCGPLAYQHPNEQLIILGDDVAPAKPGDWIVRDKFNDFWPLQDDVFHATYRTSL